MLRFQSRNKCILCPSKENLHFFPKESVSEGCELLNIYDYSPKMRICSSHFDKSFVANKKLRLGAKPNGNTETFKRKGSRKCCVRSCGKSTGDSVSLFHFPEDERKTTWENLTSTLGCGKQLYICETHFEKRFFLRPDRLSRNALPTLLLTNLQNEHQAQESEAQMDCSETAVDLSPQLKFVDTKVSSVPFCTQDSSWNELYTAETAIDLSPQLKFVDTKVCCVPFCTQDSSWNELYAFPKDPHHLKMWCNLCGLSFEKDERFICKGHFKLDCITSQGQGLKANAMPTIFPIPSVIQVDLEDNISFITGNFSILY